MPARQIEVVDHQVDAVDHRDELAASQFMPDELRDGFGQFLQRLEKRDFATLFREDRNAAVGVGNGKRPQWDNPYVASTLCIHHHQLTRLVKRQFSNRRRWLRRAL